MPRGLHPTTHLIATRDGSDVVAHVERLGGWIVKPVYSRSHFSDRLPCLEI